MLTEKIDVMSLRRQHVRYLLASSLFQVEIRLEEQFVLFRSRYFNLSGLILHSIWEKLQNLNFRSARENLRSLSAKNVLGL